MKKSEFKKEFCEKCGLCASPDATCGCAPFLLCENDDTVAPINAIINKMREIKSLCDDAPVGVLDVNVLCGPNIRVEWPDEVERIAEQFGVPFEKNTCEVFCWIANTQIYADRRN